MTIKINKKLKPHLVFAIFAFMLYGNTLNHSFVLDDAIVLYYNKFTQMGINGIPDILKNDSFYGWELNDDEYLNVEHSENKKGFIAGGRYRPASLVTFALEVEFFGKENVLPNSNKEIRFIGNAFVSHLVNIVLYLFTICLLFLILSRLIPISNDKQWYISFPFITTLLFLFHPIHTEVVANIKGRDEIMALLGSLGSLWFIIRYFDTNKYFYLAFSGICLFLGLLSKENTITFLVIIPVTIHYFISNKKAKLLLSFIPLITASVLFLLIRAYAVGIQDSTHAMSDILNNPFIDSTKNESLATVFYTLLLYVKLLFFPHPLTYDYYPYHIEIVNWSNSIALFSLFFYLGIGIYAIYGLFRKRDMFSYAIWFYLLPLSIVSNLFFTIGVFMGERFVFFSSIGFVLLIGWLIYTYIPKAINNVKLSKYSISTVMFIILCLYAAKTINRNMVWKDNYTLYSTDVKISKNSAKANFFAGCEYYSKAIFTDTFEESQRSYDNCEEATQYFLKALKLLPLYPEAAYQLGSLYFYCKRDVAKSLHYYSIAFQFLSKKIGSFIEGPKQVLDLTPEFLENNGIISTPEEIITSCDELLAVLPNFGEAYYVKGLVYGKYLNNIDLSILNFERSLTLDFQKTTKFYEYVGTAYGMKGNYSKAIMYLQKAIESGTDDYATYINLGVIYRQIGDRSNAELFTSKGNEIKNNNIININDK